MLSESGLLDQMQQNSNDATGQPVCVYGQVGYPVVAHSQKLSQVASLNIMMRNWLYEEFSQNIC